MQAQSRTKPTEAASRFTGHIVTSYTCPRCRQYGQASRCPRCGWTPEDVTTAAQASPGHDDRIIAC
jgi:hypothetical protein